MGAFDLFAKTGLSTVWLNAPNYLKLFHLCCLLFAELVNAIVGKNLLSLAGQKKNLLHYQELYSGTYTLDYLETGLHRIREITASSHRPIEIHDFLDGHHD